ncbi:pore-forming ESAT-6 family protein [Couchioplanes azureus]|uniref:pore-forming ESAT-6 family protein n=1 Tax=Couchioplanes caeruleus TaxID=56438 RepID=UPI00167045C6|nr:pore-forming ESAT-6 family protein [Couchioplanes caeruleus]GGQ71407.1 hypothetical protein GCM10010166_46930 [Couchioplanes caeruleus subsp. azureus]
MNSDRRSFDMATSSEAQGNLQAVVARLEVLINDRDAAVKAAMADFLADGVAEQYHDKEVRWNSAAAEVRSIIALVRTTLQRNDETAQSTLSRAKAAVDAIG